MAATAKRKARGPSKPRNVAENAFMSAKWDEVCEGRSFSASDAPTLALLVQWYAVVERCISDMDVGDGLPQVAYENNMGDIKAVPMIQTMKQASAEIRQLNKQLGIVDGADVGGGGAGAGKDSVLRLVSQNREQRAAR